MATTLLAARTSVAAVVARRVVISGGRRTFSALLSLDEEFPDLPSTTPTPSKVGSTEITKLDNGLIVATENGASTSTVSLTFPNGGSSSEASGSSEAGAALANKCFAFKSGCGHSSIAILRSLENGGVTAPFTSSSRYSASVGYTTSPEYASGLVGALVTSTNSDYEKWDVKEAVANAKIAAGEAASSPESALTEQIYAAAYGPQSSLGKPYYSPLASASGLVSFRQRNYVLGGAVLAATGVTNHDAFVASVVEAVEAGDAPTGSSEEGSGGAAYLGGEARIAAPCGGKAFVALAGVGPTDPAILAVAKHVLALQGVSSFAAPGLIGVYASSDSAGAGSVTEALCAALTSSVSASDVTKAKILAKAEAMFALDGGSKGVAEAMASSILSTGSFAPGAAFDAVSDKDVTDALAAMAKSNPSLAAVGEIDAVPYQATIASKFG